MFDPLVGRFLEEDPIDFAAGDPNLYRYVKNNPTNRTDPSGLQEEPAEQPNPQLVDLDAQIAKQGTSRELKKPEFPFEGGTGKVEVFTGVSFKDGHSDVIRLKFSADVSVEHAHWLQIVKSMIFTSKHEPKVPAEERLFPACTSEKDAIWSIKRKMGEWHVDTVKDNTAFYDESGGVYYRDKNEISIFDKPYPHLGQFRKGDYETMNFIAYLVSKGKVYYAVHWSVSMTDIGNGLLPEIDYYDWDVGGGPVSIEDLHKYVKTETLPLGLADGLLRKKGLDVAIKPPRLITVPNPINLKQDK